LKQCAHKDGFLDSCIGAVQERPPSIATGASLWGSPNNHAISPLACNRPSKSAWPDSYTIPSLHAAHLQGSTIHHPFIQSHRPPHRGAGASHREMTAKHLDQGHITHSPPPTTSFSFTSPSRNLQRRPTPRPCDRSCGHKLAVDSRLALRRHGTGTRPCPDLSQLTSAVGPDALLPP
jgi:hypothetical protein